MENSPAILVFFEMGIRLIAQNAKYSRRQIVCGERPHLKLRWTPLSFCAGGLMRGRGLWTSRSPFTGKRTTTMTKRGMRKKAKVGIAVLLRYGCRHGLG